MISVAFKKATSSQEISEDGPFELRFDHNCNLIPVIFVEKTEGAECTGCWTPFVNTHVWMMHQPQLRARGWYCTTNYC